MAHGTLFEADTKLQTTTRHKVPQAEGEAITACGINLFDKLPENWSGGATWNIEPHPGKREVRCKKCYPHFRRK